MGKEMSVKLTAKKRRNANVVKNHTLDSVTTNKLNLLINIIPSCLYLLFSMLNRSVLFLFNQFTNVETISSQTFYKQFFCLNSISDSSFKYYVIIIIIRTFIPLTAGRSISALVQLLPEFVANIISGVNMSLNILTFNVVVYGPPMLLSAKAQLNRRHRSASKNYNNDQSVRKQTSQT